VVTVSEGMSSYPAASTVCDKCHTKKHIPLNPYLLVFHEKYVISFEIYRVIKKSCDLMITTQKVTSNVQSVTRQSPDTY
jgi:hypothetical protein